MSRKRPDTKRGSSIDPGHLIFAAVKKARRPMSAYGLLGQLRHQGLTAPPTIYRALKRLAEEGRVHRIESLNAYVACVDSERHGAAGFAICGGCGRVAEFPCAGAVGPVERWAREAGFDFETMTLELHGTCAPCSAQEAKS